MTQSAPVPDRLSDDLAEYRSGITLSQSMYLDPAMFAFEMEHVLGNNWWFARFSSELSDAGDYAVLQIGNASIVLARDREMQARAFYNTCRHRGATLCRETSGNTKRFTCPYHAWTYGLDGELLSAPQMYDDFDRASFPLHTVHVRETSGLIFVNLARGTPPDFDSFCAPYAEYLSHYGFPKVKVATRRRYEINANWKLAIENLLECYHCLPSHPGLCAVEGRDELVAFAIDPSSPGGTQAIGKVQAKLDAMHQRAQELGVPTTLQMGVREETGPFATMRYPLAPGFSTGTLDGEVILPFLGCAADALGTGVRIAFSTTTFLQLYSDHAVCLSYLPLSSERTVVEQAWVVDASAELSEATLTQLTALWDGVTSEDGALAENQVAGIRQPVYEPGPLSSMEGGTRGFLDWYIDRMKQSIR